MFCINGLDLNLIKHTNVAQVSIWQIYSFHFKNVNMAGFCQIFVHNVQMCVFFFVVVVQNDFMSTLNKFWDILKVE